MVHRTKILIALNIKTQDSPMAVARMIHAVWSVSVTTAKGAYCPGGTEKPEFELELDIIEEDPLDQVR